MYISKFDLERSISDLEGKKIKKICLLESLCMATVSGAIFCTPDAPG